MMAITPMPPTISAIDEMTIRASTMARVKLFRMPRIESAVTMSKSFSWSSLSRCRLRMTCSMSLMMSCCVKPSRGTAAIWIMRST